MRTQVIRCGPVSADATRLVMLPGAYHALDDFVDAGFEQALRARGLAAELILAAPELSHLGDRAWLAQLRAEVIAPARARARCTVARRHIAGRIHGAALCCRG